MMRLETIGTYHTDVQDKCALPHQSGTGCGAEGQVILTPHCNYEQAVEDLRSFERVWLLFGFHHVDSWKPKVQPPRSTRKRGVFATRSPHRPNPIGMSAVPLIAVEGRILHIGECDLLDGTPIYDIKPYLPYCDAYPRAEQGWTAEIDMQRYTIDYTDEAREQLGWLAEHANLPLDKRITPRLSLNPFPHPSHRIRRISVSHNGQETFELAYKTWRVTYTIDPDAHLVCVSRVSSGYDRATLDGCKHTRWDDLEAHQAFEEYGMQRSKDVLALELRG